MGRGGEAAAHLRSVSSLIDDCFHKRARAEGELADPDDEAIRVRMLEAAETLGDGDGAMAAAELVTLVRKRSRWKLYRGDLWRDCQGAVSDLASGRVEATVTVRQKATNSGRKLPSPTVSTPHLLLYGEVKDNLGPAAQLLQNSNQPVSAPDPSVIRWGKNAV
jgi:hypothetical protein